MCVCVCVCVCLCGCVCVCVCVCVFVNGMYVGLKSRYAEMDEQSSIQSKR